MKTVRRDGAVRMKLTISREEHPALFEALFCIGNPRRRTGRLKELIIKGLTLELANGTPLVTSGANGTKIVQPGTSVSSMLEWDSSQS